eukprot:TRINITY_DN24816_c0_g1_i1.p1 TRINITY_DN24816_c0_g1~~TRINITY_DN24816_c0_g1_i1.p1  ORF type:complete len:497 (+),score=80.71 TRINITY_DN24816_c0_g1_i1:3-1493(+)
MKYPTSTDKERMLRLVIELSAIAASSILVAGVGYFMGPPKRKTATFQQGGGYGPEEAGGPEGYPSEEAESKEAEAMFQMLIQQLNEAITVRDFDLADKRAQALHKFAKSFGEKSMNYGFVLGIPLANYYEVKGDYAAMEGALRESADILPKHGMEYLTETGILEKLLNLYLTKGDYEKAEKYAHMAHNWRKNQLRERRSPENMEKFGLAANKYGLILSNLGKFKLAESQFKEALKVFQDAPSATLTACQTLEYYSNTLHQQGKTLDAVKEINAYREKTSKQSDPKKTKIAIIRRIATLLFTIDEFQESIKYLQMVLEENPDPAVEIQVLSELANSYWEINNEAEATAAQNKIRARTPTAYQSPNTRSKYLCTIECVVDTRLQGYTMIMRVNREQPKRKEGEPLEDTTQLKRKLEKCFLEIQYQTPDGSFVTETYPVETPHEFILKSSPLNVEPAKWYEVIISIYEDKAAFEEKKEKVGVHHQLIYSFPPTSYVHRV